MNTKLSVFFIFIALLFHQEIWAYEHIEWFKSDIKIETNGDILITETIKVKAEGNEIRRGIFRALPVIYYTPKKFQYKVKYDIIQVLKDNLDEKYFIKKDGDFILIYIGDENTYLNEAFYTYEITYKTSRQIGFFENYDEFYWNVNGNEWSFETHKVEATITLPLGAKIKNYAAYTGFRGEKGTDFNVEKRNDNTIHFQSTRLFSAKENLSIGVNWQKGILQQPSKAQNLILFFKDNYHILIALLGTFFVLLIHLGKWRKVGIDPPSGTIIPIFKPMSNLSPSAMRYILKMETDEKAFTAALVSLATKGFVTIENKNDIYTIFKTEKTTYDELSKSELAIITAMFGKNKSFKIAKERHAQIRSVIQHFYGKEESAHQETYFKLNRGHLVPGIVISVLTIMFLFFAFTTLNANSVYTNTQYVIAFSIVGIIVLINLLFIYLMKAPTLFGRKEMDKIEGFKMYLKTAEEQRLDAMNLPEKTPQLFEEYLPYAIALDCENQWAKKFKNIIAAAIEDGTYTQPTWYIGGRGMHFIPTNFTDSIGESFSDAVSYAATAPSQSGGGSIGGGFSGGGGGGGGGGGW